MQFDAYVLLGPPMSGKEAQGRLLGRIPHLVHVSMDAIFASLDPESEAGKFHQQAADRGDAVPDLFMVEMLRHHVRTITRQGLARPGVDTLVLDGVPRNAAQAAAIRTFINVRTVFHLGLPSDALKLSGTSAPAVEATLAKVRSYVPEAIALLNHYRPIMRVITGTGTPQDTLREILRTLLREHEAQRLHSFSLRHGGMPIALSALG